MRLYLMRHGRAGDAPTDAERRLTKHGGDEVARVARSLRSQGAVQAAIVSSPLIRARETAGILARELGVAEVTADPRMAAGASPEALLAVIQGYGDQPALVMVGHMPEMGVLSGRLATGGREQIFDLKPAVVVCMTLDPDLMRDLPGAIARSAPDAVAGSIALIMPEHLRW